MTNHIAHIRPRIGRALDRSANTVLTLAHTSLTRRFATGKTDFVAADAAMDTTDWLQNPTPQMRPSDAQPSANATPRPTETLATAQPTTTRSRPETRISNAKSNTNAAASETPVSPATQPTAETLHPHGQRQNTHDAPALTRKTASQRSLAQTLKSAATRQATLTPSRSKPVQNSADVAQRSLPTLTPLLALKNPIKAQSAAQFLATKGHASQASEILHTQSGQGLPATPQDQNTDTSHARTPHTNPNAAPPKHAAPAFPEPAQAAAPFAAMPQHPANTTTPPSIPARTSTAELVNAMLRGPETLIPSSSLSPDSTEDSFDFENRLRDALSDILAADMLRHGLRIPGAF